jgi:hypothetical protein
VFVQDRREDADELYCKAADIDASSKIAEIARERLSEIAQKIFRNKAPDAERMDAVMYLVGAIERFGRMSKQEVQRVGIEIATLGLMEFRGLTTHQSPLTTHHSLRRQAAMALPMS